MILDLLLNYDRYLLDLLDLAFSTTEFLAAEFEKRAHIWCRLINKSDLKIVINFSTQETFLLLLGILL